MFYVRELTFQIDDKPANIAGTLFVVLTSPFWGRLSREGNAIVFAYSTIWQALFYSTTFGKDLGMMSAWHAILAFGGGLQPFDVQPGARVRTRTSGQTA